MGDYIIERPVSRAGLWFTYLGWHAARERERVNVRALRAHTATQLTLVEGFARHAQLFASLDHPGIVPVIATGVDQGVPLIITPEVQGVTLDERVAATGDAGLEPGAVAKIVSELAAVLAYLHARERPIIQRDLAPSKIVLAGTASRVRMIEVGLEHALRTAGIDVEALGLRPIAYHAPEELSRPSRVGPALDQFVLASLAFECLTTRRAFGDDDAVARAAIANDGPRPRLGAYRPDLPDAVEAVLDRAWAHLPTARYASIDLFAQALARVLDPGGDHSMLGPPGDFTDMPTFVGPTADQPSKAPDPTLDPMPAGSTVTRTGSGPHHAVLALDAAGTEEVIDQIFDGLVDKPATASPARAAVAPVEPKTAPTLPRRPPSGTRPAVAAPTRDPEATPVQPASSLRIPAASEAGAPRVAEVVTKQVPAVKRPAPPLPTRTSIPRPAGSSPSSAGLGAVAPPRASLSPAARPPAPPSLAPRPPGALPASLPRPSMAAPTGSMPRPPTASAVDTAPGLGAAGPTVWPLTRAPALPPEEPFRPAAVADAEPAAVAPAVDPPAEPAPAVVDPAPVAQSDEAATAARPRGNTLYGLGPAAAEAIAMRLREATVPPAAPLVAPGSPPIRTGFGLPSLESTLTSQPHDATGDDAMDRTAPSAQPLAPSDPPAIDLSSSDFALDPTLSAPISVPTPDPAPFEPRASIPVPTTISPWTPGDPTIRTDTVPLTPPAIYALGAHGDFDETPPPVRPAVSPPARISAPPPRPVPPSPPATPSRGRGTTAALIFGGLAVVAASIFTYGVWMQREERLARDATHAAVQPQPQPAIVAIPVPAALDATGPMGDAAAAQPVAVGAMARDAATDAPRLDAAAAAVAVLDRDASVAAASGPDAPLASPDASVPAAPALAAVVDAGSPAGPSTAQSPASTGPIVVPADARRLDRPDFRQELAAREAMNERVAACEQRFGHHGRHARVAVTYDGATGRAHDVTLAGTYFSSRPIGGCIEQAVRDVAFPPFRAAHWTSDFVFMIH